MAELIAIDPGPHTGLAFLRDGTVRASRTLDTAWLGERGLYTSLAKLLSDTALTRTEPVQLVVEGFNTVMRPTPEGMMTIKLIGWITGLAYLYEYPLEVQLPSVRTPFVPDAGKLMTRGATRHERDAIAHGLAYFARQSRLAKREAPGGA